MTPEEIKDLRKRRGWTQKDLAENLFVTQEAISRWELLTTIDHLKHDPSKQLVVVFFWPIPTFFLSLKVFLYHVPKILIEEIWFIIKNA